MGWGETGGGRYQRVGGVRPVGGTEGWGGMRLAGGTKGWGGVRLAGYQRVGWGETGGVVPKGGVG